MIRPRYIGKAEYCYANSAAMLLDSIGETVRPETIEVGCGIGLGAFVEEASGNLFFSPFVVAPDEGLNRAFHILGFKTVRGSFEPDAALAGLRGLLQKGPVVIGPVDMGHMVYNPYRAAGADHYVFVYGSEDDSFLIHDPGGYPHASLTADDLLAAWRAETIGYKEDSFQYWHSPQRVNQPNEGQIHASIRGFFQEIYTEIKSLQNSSSQLLAAEAINHYADTLVAGNSAGLTEKFLLGFQLPLAAKRAGDYATAFNSSWPEFAEHKSRLAKCFGRAYSYLSVGNKPAAAAVLREIADLETEVAGLFFTAS